MGKRGSRPPKIGVEVWKCEELHKVVREAIEAHVKDVAAASRLEQVLQGFYAYAPASKLMILDEPAAPKKK